MLNFKNEKVRSIFLETSSSNETILSSELKRRLQSHQFGASEPHCSLGERSVAFSSVNFEPCLIHKNVRKTTSVKDDPSPVHAPQCVHYVGGHRKLLCSLKPQMRGVALSQTAFET